MEPKRKVHTLTDFMQWLSDNKAGIPITKENIHMFRQEYTAQK